MASQRAFREVPLLFDNFFLVSWMTKLFPLFVIGNLDSVDGVAVSVYLYMVPVLIRVSTFLITRARDISLASFF
jgi:hypothetical protein